MVANKIQLTISVDADLRERINKIESNLKMKFPISEICNDALNVHIKKMEERLG